MKNILSMTIALLLGWLIVPAVAQNRMEVSGEQTQGSWLTDLSNNSSKFNEYRDIRDGYYFLNMWLDVLDTLSGRFIKLDGENLLRTDQSVRFQIGDLRRGWKFIINRDEIPHRYSNSAMTPFIYRGSGLFTLPDQVSIIKDGDDATGTPSLVPTAPQMTVNDSLIADYLKTFLRPEELAIQRNRTDIALNFLPSNQVAFHLNYSDERRDGSKLAYGPIGDRPPRTLNVQVQEPVDYITREIHAGFEYSGKRLQSQLRYVLSLFENNINAMQWENIYFEPDVGSDFVASVAGTPRNVSSFGQRSLAPDNFAHNIAFSGGLNLPRGSRLTSTAAFGSMRQNDRLLPYSFSTLGGDLNGDGLSWNDTAKLPRNTADAEMRTLRLNLEYSINPVARLNLRAFFNHDKLDNNTPAAQWKYVSQDAAGTNGAVNYRNYRRNLAYAYNRLNFGIDTRYSLAFWRTSLGLGYKRQGIGRDFRESDTDENIIEASLRTRPANWLSLRAGYLYGDRQGDGYNYNVTRQSYWYSFDQGAADVDNPKFLFANHPDLRKFDVSDRARNDIDLATIFLTNANLDFTVGYRYRNDDFESGVSPIAPLLGTTVPLPNPADENARTPGQQLGLLENTRQNINLDFNYTPSERWSFTLFADRESAVFTHRGMVFNENQRREPSNATIQSPTQLGPWTDPDRLYNAEIDNETITLGMGVRHEIIQGKFRALVDYTMSRSKVDLLYSGYGSDADFLGRDWETFQFGFDDPSTARINYYILNASLECELSQRLMLGLHYLFDRYSIRDWQQEPSGPWVEEVGSEFFLRDTSQDNRWGNRLVNMGSYLAPTYTFHGGYVTLTYRL
jgi:MtrB/PioB family decaheme-associated outer membrane protein